MASEPIVTEQTLLIASHKSPHDIAPAAHPLSTHSRRVAIVVVFSITFSSTLALWLSEAPRLRLLEESICSRWYATHDPSIIGLSPSIDQKFCKIEPIQSQLSSLRGWQVLANMVPGILLSIPFGIMADKYGRKWFVVMNVASLFCRGVWFYFVCFFYDRLSPNLVIFEAIGAVFGGGSLVFGALMYTILAGLTTEDQRTTVFFRLDALASICAFVGPLISAAIVDKNPWILVIIALVLQLLSIILALILPETYAHNQAESEQDKLLLSVQADREASKQPCADGISSNAQEGEGDGGTNSRTLITGLKGILDFLWKDPSLFCILWVFPIETAQTVLAEGIFLQYISIRLSRTVAEASLLSSLRAVINTVLFLAIIPWLSSRCVHAVGWTARQNDLFMARASFCILGFGAFIMGVAPTYVFLACGLVIFTIGSGAGLATRSYVTPLVRTTEIATLYAIISILNMIGLGIFSLLHAKLLNMGVHMRGDLLSGLPFFVSSAAFLAAAFGLMTLPKNRPPDSH